MSTKSQLLQVKGDFIVGRFDISGSTPKPLITITCQAVELFSSHPVQELQSVTLRLDQNQLVGLIDQLLDEKARVEALSAQGLNNP